jgi:hypothetical protein
MVASTAHAQSRCAVFDRRSNSVVRLSGANHEYIVDVDKQAGSRLTPCIQPIRHLVDEVAVCVFSGVLDLCECYVWLSKSDVFGDGTGEEDGVLVNELRVSNVAV